MSADEIHQAVAKATGDDIHTIAGLGFVLLEPTANHEATVAPDHVAADDTDWDDGDLERYLAMCG
jgi:hypothetical protein